MTAPRSTPVPGVGSIVRLNDLTVTASFEAMLRANGLDTTESLFQNADGECLSKAGLSRWRERWRLELAHRGRTETFFLKRFAAPPNSAQRAVRRAANGASSVAALEWNWMHRLAAIGIPCPTPVALGETLERGTERRSAILMAAVPGQSLEAWAAQLGPDDCSTIQMLIHTSADLIARFHRAGFIHRDLYLSHVFFDPKAPPEHALHLIDLQRVYRPHAFRRRWIVKDLAALNYSAPNRLVSRSDRLRWLKRYLGVTKMDAAARRLVYRVVGKTARIARHDHRRARA